MGGAVVSGYAKGPWRVEHKDSYIPDDWQEKPVQVVSAYGIDIACNTAFYPTALDPANASLIAAAPELLEALRALLKEVDREDYTYALFVNARAAIAKAEGRTDA